MHKVTSMTLTVEKKISSSPDNFSLGEIFSFLDDF